MLVFEIKVQILKTNNIIIMTNVHINDNTYEHKTFSVIIL